MGVLASIPVWAYFIVLLLTYVGAHVLTFDAGKVMPAGRAFWGRIGSSLLLLIALIVFRREEPATLLLALALAVGGGFLSGRSTVPPKGAQPGTGAAPGEGPQREDE